MAGGQEQEDAAALAVDLGALGMVQPRLPAAGDDNDLERLAMGLKVGQYLWCLQVPPSLHDSLSLRQLLSAPLNSRRRISPGRGRPMRDARLRSC